MEWVEVELNGSDVHWESAGWAGSESQSLVCTRAGGRVDVSVKLPGRRKRPQRSFMDVVKGDTKKKRRT